MDAADDLLDGEPPVIDPYEVLRLERTATADQVKAAYRKLALKNHPDKVSEDQKQKAHETFQSIAFAYAVLSDPARRKRYDETGSTSESIVDADGFSWSDFYREQFRDAISNDAIEKFAAQYKGSDEERDDVLVAYEENEGDMDAIYETVMLSNVLEDDERFREIIDHAIAKKDVPVFKAYAKETKKSRQARIKAAQSEATEAEDYAKELGIHDKLFGDKKEKGKGKGKGGKTESSEDQLAALIRRNQQTRGSFLDNLEAKYGAAPKAGKKGKKRQVDETEPSEAAFQAAAAKLKKSKKNHCRLQNAMTAADTLTYYPQYCFHLSPTATEWCPLRAIDIARLGCQPGFQEHGIFFYLNHPIKWVRITGLVVAVDEYYGRRVYTIDDSSGHCIECTLKTSTTAAETRNHRSRGQGKESDAQITYAKAAPGTGANDDIDVGTVLDVKGYVKLFRDQKQIDIHKAIPVLSTNQEVLFWNKIRDFQRRVLSQPWVLRDKEIRRCRKLQQLEAAGQERETRKRHAKAQTTRAENASGSGITRPGNGHGDKYDALGL
ncbi:hypothetical protein F4808DRAFT_453886 [Astrocystis sublimbata]|nr:hypothetical protein F4808DRAFT_453886 [Astrocystis sublimbata]